LRTPLLLLQVLFLPSGSKLPYQQTPAPAVSADAATDTAGFFCKECLRTPLLLLQVLFLPSGSKLPYQQAPAPAASAATDTARKATQLPQALQTRLAGKRRQLVPGFICNLFLAKPEGAEQQPKLFGLSEWAGGSAGAALNDRPWVPNSRLQVGVSARALR
jgi:hypothetical protein